RRPTSAEPDDEGGRGSRHDAVDLNGEEGPARDALEIQERAAGEHPHREVARTSHVERADILQGRGIVGRDDGATDQRIDGLADHLRVSGGGATSSAKPLSTRIVAT